LLVLGSSLCLLVLLKTALCLPTLSQFPDAIIKLSRLRQIIKQKANTTMRTLNIKNIIVGFGLYGAQELTVEELNEGLKELRSAGLIATRTESREAGCQDFFGVYFTHATKAEEAVGVVYSLDSETNMISSVLHYEYLACVPHANILSLRGIVSTVAESQREWLEDRRSA
jgi:hypothetical protein